jgi:hypothetical protein
MLAQLPAPVVAASEQGAAGTSARAAHATAAAGVFTPVSIGPDRKARLDGADRAAMRAAAPPRRYALLGEHVASSQQTNAATAGAAGAALPCMSELSRSRMRLGLPLVCPLAFELKLRAGMIVAPCAMLCPLTCSRCGPWLAALRAGARRAEVAARRGSVVARAAAAARPPRARHALVRRLVRLLRGNGRVLQGAARVPGVGDHGGARGGRARVLRLGALPRQRAPWRCVPPVRRSACLQTPSTLVRMPLHNLSAGLLHCWEVVEASSTHAREHAQAARAAAAMLIPCGRLARPDAGAPRRGPTQGPPAKHCEPARAGGNPLGERRSLLVLRGTLGYASITCFFLACQRLPLADATALTFLAPLAAAALSPWALGEWPGAATAAAIPACLAGVLLLTQPSFLFGGGSARLSGVGLAFGLLQPLFNASAKVREHAYHAPALARQRAVQAAV